MPYSHSPVRLLEGGLTGFSPYFSDRLFELLVVMLCDTGHTWLMMRCPVHFLTGDVCARQEFISSVAAKHVIQATRTTELHNHLKGRQTVAETDLKKLASLATI